MKKTCFNAITCIFLNNSSCCTQGTSFFRAPIIFSRLFDANKILSVKDCTGLSVYYKRHFLSILIRQQKFLETFPTCSGTILSHTHIVLDRIVPSLTIRHYNFTDSLASRLPCSYTLILKAHFNFGKTLYHLCFT